MASDRNTPEGVENWLVQSSTNPWSFPSIVGPELTREILQHICSRWSLYPPNIKLGVLLALLCIRKLLLSSMGNELTAIISNGCNDNDEWVRLVSKMLQNYPSTGALDLNIEQHIPHDAQLGLHSLMDRIQQTGIKFHPTEYAFIDRDISDAFSTLLINAEAVRTPSSHFILRQGCEISRQQRLYALNNVAMIPPSPGLTSPVNATGFNFMSDQNRTGVSQATSTGPSLFIPPKRRPSQLTQPFHRPPNPQKSGPTITSRGSFSGSSQGPDSPTEPKITQGKKYVKPTKIQILDITTATTITRNQEETKLKTQMEEQQMKEMRRQERERRQEEKRREEEEKKKQKEREKAEKQRLKEEARMAKEKEKREKAAAKAAAAAAAASNEINDTQPTNVPAATRKKKKTNSKYFSDKNKIQVTAALSIFMKDDETIEDEIVSDGELPHKKPKKSVEPIPLLSPTHLYQPDRQISSTDDYNSVMISQNGSSSNSNSINTSATQAAITEPSSSVSEQPMVADPELPRSQFEEIPRNEMNEALRKQFEMNCGAVLDKSNKIHGDNRQLIINFLGGHHTKPEQREKLMSISSGVSCSEDEIRHIILHEEKTPIPNEGKEIQETFIFEMNLSNGQWRKLKRKKTKAVKNPNLEASNGRPNGKFHGR